jgi:hypothetical protein
MRTHLIVLALFVGLLSIPSTPAFAQTQTCSPVDQSTEEVLPGVTLTYDSSFLCTDAPDTGSYSVTVTVSNAASSSEAVRIESLELSHTTPRPRGRAPSASADASGLPLTIAPGESASFTVSGSYQLVTTDEGKKANLHLRANGVGVSTNLPFQLGINVLLRGLGATE